MSEPSKFPTVAMIGIPVALLGVVLALAIPEADSPPEPPPSIPVVELPPVPPPSLSTVEVPPVAGIQDIVVGRKAAVALGKGLRQLSLPCRRGLKGKESA